jgi:hypothetical protein
MDTRNSALVVGLYLAGVVVIALIGLGYYSYQQPQAAPAPLPNLNQQPVARPGWKLAPDPVRSLPSAPYFHAQLAKEKQILREQQESLAESRALLEKHTAALKQKNAECQVLKAELDQSFLLILTLLADDSRNASAKGESAQRAKAKLEAELARLMDSLEQSEILSNQQERQLTKLRTDLQRTDLELAAIQEQSELELTALLAERRTFESVVTEIIARCGMSAIPLLVERLADERVEVRRWAVKALGRIGPEAQEAEAAMRRLLTDPEPSVREEAQRAVALLY